MRKALKAIGETIAIGGLNVGVLLYVIYVFMILLYALFNYKPYHHTSSGTTFGLLDFEKGIPVNVSFHKTVLPDTSIHFESSKGATEYTIGGNQSNQYPGGDLITGKIYADTINTRYRDVNAGGSHGNDFIITGVSLDKGVIHIQTNNTGRRLLFLAPQLLAGIISIFCFWQISRLLQSISKGISFAESNLKRLQNVGWLIIAYQAILLFLPFFSYFNFIVDFSSSIPHYRSPVSLNASPDYGFSLNWLIMGSSILIISSSFKKGIQLQQEQDLTI